jgi:hypothetical protein
MRITDDRYTRDRLRLDLALRLIRHEARTRTIRSWTGLTDDRIRKLYRSYVADAGRRDAALRPRPPEEGWRGCAGRGRAPALGRDFFEAYETFVSLNGQPQISFEHACHLLRSLEKQNEICLDDCEACGSLLVVMRYAERPKACEFCAASRPPARPGLSVGDC